MTRVLSVNPVYNESQLKLVNYVSLKFKARFTVDTFKKHPSIYFITTFKIKYHSMIFLFKRFYLHKDRA